MPHLKPLGSTRIAGERGTHISPTHKPLIPSHSNDQIGWRGCPYSPHKAWHPKAIETIQRRLASVHSFLFLAPTKYLQERRVHIKAGIKHQFLRALVLAPEEFGSQTT